MISLITTFDPQRLPLLPWFVRHYRACGVTAFYINLHFDSGYGADQQAHFVERANAILGALDLRLHSAFSCPYDSRANRQRHDQIQSEIAARSPWIVWADSDELHELPDDLSSLTAHMSRNSIDFAAGCLVDRMARRGFPALREDISPWREFPLGTDITRSVLQGCANKILLTRADARLSEGNHVIRAAAVPKRLSGIYPVHHFKWDASVVTRLGRRLEDDWKQRCPWWPESSRAIEWIEAGGKLAGMDLFDFEDDLHPGDGGPFGGSLRYTRNQVRANARAAGSSE